MNYIRLSLPLAVYKDEVTDKMPPCYSKQAVWSRRASFSWLNHQIEHSYSTKLINSYLMTTFRCPSDILFTSCWLFTMWQSTWPRNHLVPCVAELVGSCVPIHACRGLPSIWSCGQWCGWHDRPMPPARQRYVDMNKAYWTVAKRRCPSRWERTEKVTFGF